MATPPQPSSTGALLPERLGDGTACLATQPTPNTCITIDTSDASAAIIDGLGAGDSHFHRNFLSKQEADQLFDILSVADNGEVPYQQWYHMPDRKKPSKPLAPLRRIKCAMAVPTLLADHADPLVPLYRFPVNDQQRYGEVAPMTPSIEMLRQRASALLGIEFNHAVVLLYRDGDDCIGFHKDKTLDLQADTPIISIALGAERPYVLRDDLYKPTMQYELLFRHGSLLSLGYRTNDQFYHSVRKLSADEQAAAATDDPNTHRARVSITFRAVATYKHQQSGRVYGQGAEYQTLNWPETLNGMHRMDDNLTEPAMSSEV
jgi:hypothetical protein